VIIRRGTWRFDTGTPALLPLRSLRTRTQRVDHHGQYFTFLPTIGFSTSLTIGASPKPGEPLVCEQAVARAAPRFDREKIEGPALGTGDEPRSGPRWEFDRTAQAKRLGWFTFPAIRMVSTGFGLGPGTTSPSNGRRLRFCFKSRAQGMTRTRTDGASQAAMMNRRGLPFLENRTTSTLSLA
jgi:hypothetical protein